MIRHNVLIFPFLENYMPSYKYFIFFCLTFLRKKSTPLWMFSSLFNYQLNKMTLPVGLCMWPDREQPGESPLLFHTTQSTPGSQKLKGRLSGEERKLRDQCWTITSPDWADHLKKKIRQGRRWSSTGAKTPHEGVKMSLMYSSTTGGSFLVIHDASVYS